jgi:hypothetical protein
VVHRANKKERRMRSLNSGYRKTIGLLMMVGISLAGVGIAGASEPTLDRVDYQLAPDMVDTSGSILVARFVITLEDRVLTDHRVVVRPEGDTLSIPVLAPGSRLVAEIAPLVELYADKMQVKVWIGDRYVESLSWAELVKVDRPLSVTKVDPNPPPVVVIPPPVVGDPGACENACLIQRNTCMLGCGVNEVCYGRCEFQYRQCILGCPNADPDGDGYPNHSDNCPTVWNNQVDCDEDDIGDACDPESGVFQTIETGLPCYIDRDDHLIYFTLELYVEDRSIDISNCSSPDLWVQRFDSDIDCWNVDEETCCLSVFWETGLCSYIGQDRCHR